MVPNNIKIIGHRGAAGLEFENTLASIQKAIDLGVFCIEIDVWQTTDGKIVVFHDDYLDRLTPGKGFISEMDFKTLQQIKLTNGSAIPTLEEIVALVKPHGKLLLVEVKTEKAFPETFRILTAELPFSGFVIGSFYHTEIRNLKQAYPGLQTAIMFECVPVGLADYLKEVDPDFVVVSIETFNDYLIQTVKSQNRKLLLYTVNTEAEIQLALNASPFGIITNFPDRFLES